MRLLKVTNKERSTVDILMIVGGIVGPLSTIPQILTIYASQDAGSVSLASWVLFSALSLVGIVYSLIHKERILLLGYTLYSIADVAVVIGVILYG